MMVYGDAARLVATAEALDGIAATTAGLSGIAPGLPRHEAIVAAFLEAAELAQGVIDARFEARGLDDEEEVERALMDLVLVFAAALGRSWETGFSEQEVEPAAALASLRALDLPGAVRCRVPEGYAHYALYPEGYFVAARTLAGTGEVQPIGVRSIGLGLAAMVAAGCRGLRPVTVRPVGHPFRRELALSDALAGRWRAAEGVFAAVDEGPGLSGSSFRAVVDRLAAGGIAPDRVHLFAGHAGEPGGEADDDWRGRWRGLDRRHVGVDDLLLRSGAPGGGLKAWVEDLVGARGEWEDLSGGAWRNIVFQGAEWPPADRQKERRKFRLKTAAGDFHVKFAGLCPYSRQKVARGRLLADAGLVPHIVGMRHGFLVERWQAGTALPLIAVDRERLVARLASYLAFRAQRFSMPPDSGADVGLLSQMLRANATEALGGGLDGDLARWTKHMHADLATMSRVAVDGRMHAWEWLVTPDGDLLKTDGIDHAAAHDLVGCQDVLWDLAGASVELLSDEEAESLRSRLEKALGRRFSPLAVAFHEAAYTAFQLGSSTMAGAANGGDAEEVSRLRRRTETFSKRLELTLAKHL